MKIVSVEEMQRIDKIAQTEMGLTGYELMDAAGRAIAEECDKDYRPERVCVVCGKGNNAGDGFVAARMLHAMGKKVSLVCLESPDSYAGAAKQAWESVADKRLTFVDVIGANAAMAAADLVIDALLGTGINGPPRGKYADVIRWMNACGKVVVSADVPSGLREMTQDEEPGEIVRAQTTYTIGLPKSILLNGPGREYAGEVYVLPINFPQELLESDQWKLNLALSSDFAEWIPPRPDNSNKGTFGHVGIIGSALEYAGATVMVARGALRSGCGLTTIYTLREANPIYKVALPEATSVILAGGQDWFAEDSAAGLEKQLKEHSVLVVGPGLGTNAGTEQFLERVLTLWKDRLVLDADALNIIAQGRLHLLSGWGDCIVTPHPGEMGRLAGMTVAEVQADRAGVATQFARQHGVTVLLKGSGTVIARPDGQAWLVPGAEPALAKGGTGDVLSGVIAALVAQGMPTWQAGVLGATAHLQAGMNCAKRLGSRGVLATEIADEIPRVMDALTLPGT